MVFPAAVMDVDLQCVKNNTEHHTNEITEERLIVRRGQAFSLLLSAERFDPRDIQITVETGDKHPKHSQWQTVLEFKTEVFCVNVCLIIITAVFSVTSSSEIIIICCSTNIIINVENSRVLQ